MTTNTRTIGIGTVHIFTVHIFTTGMTTNRHRATDASTSATPLGDPDQETPS